MRRWSSSVALTLGLVVAADSSPARAQRAPVATRLSLDWGVGLLLSLPDELESDRCGSLFAGEASVGVRYALSATIAVESSLAAGVPRPTACAAGDAAVPLDGTVTRRRPRDGVDRSVFLASRHRVAFDAWPGRRWGPRILLGGGRLWTHHAWCWSAGIGVRLGSGSAPSSVEVDRMGVALPSIDEATLYRDGIIVGRSSSPGAKIRDSMWSVRVRLPLG